VNFAVSLGSLLRVSCGRRLARVARALWRGKMPVRGKLGRGVTEYAARSGRYRFEIESIPFTHFGAPMARPPDTRRDEAIAAIRSLCAEHGLKEGCRIARELFDVPDGTWGRWRALALGRESERDEIEREARAAAATQVIEAIPAPEQLAHAVVADPVPAMRRALDFFRLLDELEHDAQLLREFALRKQPDGTTKVRVPFALKDSHRMRVDIIRLALQQAEVAHSVGRMANFNQAIIDAIGEESPECQRRIMVRLRQLQTEGEARGF
jgi:hypothetical protein